MEIDDDYENVEDKNIKDTFGPQTQNHKKCIDICVFWSCLSGGSRCLVLLTVGLGIICVLLLIFVILQHIRVLSLSDKQVFMYKKNLCGSGWFFMPTHAKNWSDSRQYCRERGADLIIINTEEKQVSLLVSSFTTNIVWIGLSDTENEGNMKWVDNSPLKQGFWVEGEPNNLGDIEDCVDLNPERPILNNWNDLSCSYEIHSICEK
uniref:Si:ch73-343l4.8 n=1 Tax=Cyprinus carpio TaxID=7962 RepID=A0A8C1PGR7_CYPCA